MKRNLFTLCLMASIFCVRAQNVLVYNLTNSTLECDTSAYGGNVYAGPLTVLGTGGFIDDYLPAISQSAPTYHFDKQGGLQFDNTAAGGFIGASHTIELYFKIEDRQRICMTDFSNLNGEDSGYYQYPETSDAQYQLNGGSYSPYITQQGLNAYNHVIITRNSSNNEVVFYLNGAQVHSATDNGLRCLPHDAGKMSFYRDYYAATHSSAGNVAYIAMYDFTLTAQQVLDEYNNLTSSSTGIASVKPVDQLKVFPNPASNTLYLTAEGILGKTEIEITGVSGQLVSKEVLLDAHQAIHIENLPAGIYTLRAKNQSNVFTTKFIKQ